VTAVGMQTERKRKEQLFSEYDLMRKWQTDKNLSLKKQTNLFALKKAGYSRETITSCLQ